MTETVYVIVLLFSSWDACWDHYHDAGLADLGAVEKCETYIREKSLAPEQSLRPKGRSD